MPNLHTHCEALELVAPVEATPCPLDHAQLFSPLSQPLAGASHG